MLYCDIRVLVQTLFHVLTERLGCPLFVLVFFFKTLNPTHGMDAKRKDATIMVWSMLVEDSGMCGLAL